jgi:hypothetical protein
VAIALDASTPAGTSQTNGATTTLASGSFTPPTGSVVVVSWQGNTDITAPASVPTIANSGSLSFTLVQWRNAADSGGAKGQCAMWYAAVGTSPGAMTVTVTTQSATTFRHARLKPLVFTGVDTVTPLVSNNEGTDSTGALDTITYTSGVANSIGVASVSDWDVTGTTFTAASGTTLDDSQTVASSINCATLRQTTPTTSGAAISLGLTSPTSTQWNWVYAELRPGSAVAAGAQVQPFVFPSAATQRAATW